MYSAASNPYMDSNLSNPNRASDPGYNITNNEQLRIVMVGKTGTGKSATGNVILGRECFESKFGGKSLTVDCAKARATVDGQQIAVIDTPGLFDTRFGIDKTTKDICQCISFASPGPHVFLVVIMLGRYTPEEQHTVQKIQEIFGQAADRFSMVLFTGGDQLESTIEEFLEDCPAELKDLLDRCNGQYHVFNNRLKDRSQVTELLQKIRNIVKKNGGSHYTNEMFQAAERAIEEEKRRILIKSEEEIRRQRADLEKELQKKYDEEIINIKMKLYEEAERKAEKKDQEEKDRELEKMLNDLKLKYDKQLADEIESLQAKHTQDARWKAEWFNPLYPLIQAGKLAIESGKKIIAAIKKLFEGESAPCTPPEAEKKS